MLEHEFKVGDWVECVDVTGLHLIKAGEFYQIDKINRSHMGFTNKEGLYPFSLFKPAIPEVGSRWITDGENDFVILKADEENVLYREVSDSDWAICRPRDFFDCCKPKPKTTVRYMDLFQDVAGPYKNRNSKPLSSDYLATIKIETDSNGKTTVTQVDLDSE